MRRKLVAGGVVLLLVAAWVWFRPFLGTPKLTTASTPSTLADRPVPLRVAPGARLCLDRVAFDARTRQALIKALGPATPALVITAPRTRTVLRGYGTGEELLVPLSVPQQDTLGTLCVRNAGRETVSLAGSRAPRRQFRGTTRIDGVPARAELSLELFEARPERMRSRAGEILEWMALWRPGIFGQAVLWLLLLLVVAGIPLGVLWTFATSVRDEEEPPRAAEPPRRGGIPPPQRRGGPGGTV